MKNVFMYVVFAVLLVVACTKPVWFNAMTDHTRDSQSQSKFVFLQLGE